MKLKKTLYQIAHVKPSCTMFSVNLYPKNSLFTLLCVVILGLANVSFLQGHGRQWEKIGVAFFCHVAHILKDLFEEKKIIKY